MPITTAEIRAVTDAGLAFQQALREVESLVARVATMSLPPGVSALEVIAGHLRNNQVPSLFVNNLNRADIRYSKAHLNQAEADRLKKRGYRHQQQLEEDNYLQHRESYNSFPSAGPRAAAGAEPYLVAIQEAAALAKQRAAIAPLVGGVTQTDWDAYNAARAAAPQPQVESEAEMKARLSAQLDKQEADIELRHQAMLRRAAEFEAKSNTMLAAHVSPSEPTPEQIAEFLSKKEPGPVTRLPTSQEEREALERKQVSNIKLDL